MIPTSRHLKITAVLVALAITADFSETALGALYVLTAAYLFIAITDAVRILLMPYISGERTLDTNVPVREWMPASLRLTIAKGSRQIIQIDELRDPEFIIRGLPATASLTPDEGAEIHYKVQGKNRGTHSFSGFEYLLYSPWQLWTQKRRVELPQSVKVQPNYQTVVNLVLQGEEQAVARMGLRQQRRRGEGTEFHQLREYRPGDAIRKIDWKASSRTNKLISKEFRDEQDQQLIFLLDTGRRMRHAEKDSAFMDDTINAMLLLSYIASRQGDSIGFMAFGNTEHWCPPQKNTSIVKHLVDHCFDIQPGLVHSDYLRSAQRLLELQKRRAMVIILTNTRDEDSEDLEKAVVLLRQRHLVAIADLQE